MAERERTGSTPVRADSYVASWMFNPESTARANPREMEHPVLQLGSSQKIRRKTDRDFQTLPQLMVVDNR